jgi:malonate transporter and related proteins
VGGIAVPAILLAYGISLRLGPRPGAGEPPIQIATLVWLKLVVHPIAAYLIGAYLVGLSGRNLLAVTVIAALPTAQNVFTFAQRYDRGLLMARDTIFIATPPLGAGHLGHYLAAGNVTPWCPRVQTGVLGLEPCA